MGGSLGYVALCIVLGGIWGVIFAISTPWRYAGGLRRWAAYGAMGAVGFLLIFAILASGGLMTGASRGSWVGTLILAAVVGALLLNVSRWVYEKLGVWTD